MDFGKWFADLIKEKSNSDQRGQRNIRAERGGFSFEAVVAETERLSCKLTEISVTYPLKHRPESHSFDALVDQLSQRLTYFQESLVLIEKDEKNERAMFRSKSPRKSPNKTEYFELMVSPSAHLVLNRIVRQGHKKQSTSFVIGFDLVERFINDLCELVTTCLTHKDTGNS